MIMAIIINIILTFTCNFFFHCSKAMQAMFVSQVHLAQHDHVFLLFSIFVCAETFHQAKCECTQPQTEEPTSCCLFRPNLNMSFSSVWGEGDSGVLQAKFCTYSTQRVTVIYSTVKVVTNQKISKLTLLIFPCRNRQFFILTNNTKVMDVEESTGCLSVEFRHLVL